MDEIQLNDWQEFECKIKDLRKKFQEPRQLVFRGVADSAWLLKTTLERHQSVEMSFADYYRVITAVQPHIQSFTKTTWDEIEPYEEIEKMAAEYHELDFHLWGGRLRAYGYMAYLRHHGFPSPLMDWTRSPYIAAFFAFYVPPRDSPPERIAIFAYCERPDGGKNFSGDKPRIFRLYPDFPKGINTMYPYILRGKLSVRPAQVGGIDVNTLLSKLSWLLRIPNVDRILPLDRGATVR